MSFVHYRPRLNQPIMPGKPSDSEFRGPSPKRGGQHCQFQFTWKYLVDFAADAGIEELWLKAAFAKYHPIEQLEAWEYWLPRNLYMELSYRLGEECLRLDKISTFENLESQSKEIFLLPSGNAIAD